MQVDDVKFAARGSWPQILMTLAPHMAEAVERGVRHGPCPFCGGDDRFRMMNTFEDDGAAICNQCGPEDRAGVFTDGFALLEHATGRSFKELLHEVAEFVGVDRGVAGNAEQRSTRPEAPVQEIDDWARGKLNEVHAEATEDDGTVSAYLQNRGLSGTVPPVLNFHPTLAYFEDGQAVGTFPAMLATVTAPDGRPVTYHRTYLSPGGTGQADVPATKKMMRPIYTGATRGGAIRLHDAGDVLAVAEGVETALAVHEATGTPVWATISAGGMGRLSVPEHVRQVEIWADNDSGERAGQRAAERLAERLHKEGRTVCVMLPEQADTDWLDIFVEDGADALRAAREAAGPWEKAPEHEDSPAVHLTDLGNARRLVAQHGQNIRYCFADGHWYIWDGRVWVRDETGEIYRLAKSTIPTIYEEAAAATDDDARRAIARHAMRSESLARLKAMIELAKSEPGIPVLREQFDKDPWLISAMNGTLNLRTGELRPHRREDYITRMVPIRYDKNATAPMFERALMETMGQRRSLVEYLQRVFGYALTGLTVEQAMFLLYGRGSNGKSVVVLDTLQELLGPYATVAEPDLLMSRRNDAHPTGIAKLVGARVAIATETGEGRSFNEALLKQLTGSDKLTGRFMRQDFFDFDPTHKLFLATNHRPTVRGTDHAIWRRLHLIPFDVTFHKPESGREPAQDPHLAEKLRAELPGVLAWAVRGCLEWQRAGLQPPAEVLAATAEYRTDMDIVAQFLDDACTIAANAMSGATDLYQTYQNWCAANGERWLSQRRFGGRLRERGYESRRGSGGRMVYDGIGIIRDYSEYKAS